MIKISLFSVTQQPYSDQKLVGEISPDVLRLAARQHLDAATKYQLVIIDWMNEVMGAEEQLVLTYDDGSESDEGFKFSRLVKNPETGEQDKEFIRDLTDEEIAFIKPLTNKYTALTKPAAPSDPMNVH